MNLEPLTTHLVLYGTTRTPEAARIAQQNYKEDLSLTLSVSLCVWLKCDLEVIIWLPVASILLISIASEASPCCYGDDYLS